MGKCCARSRQDYLIIGREWEGKASPRVRPKEERGAQRRQAMNKITDDNKMAMMTRMAACRLVRDLNWDDR